MLFCLTLVGLKILYGIRTSPLIGPLVPALSAAWLIYPALILIRRRHRTIDFLESGAAEWRSGLLLFATTTMVVFPLFGLGAHFYETLFLQRTFRSVLFPHFFSFLLFQIFLVSLPEEFFFRGYLQSLLNNQFPKKWSLWGASVGPAWPLTALLFAFSHSFITFQWWHGAIFFPALVFGWLREKSGGIVAPLLFHTASNIVVRWIELHYR